MRASLFWIKYHPPLFYNANTHSKAETLRPQGEEVDRIIISPERAKGPGHLTGEEALREKKEADQNDLC